MHDVVVYSRKGCHLCDVVKETLAQVQGEADFQWREVDIDTDPELVEAYGMEVPVVMLDGKKVAKYHLDEAMLLRRLQS